MSITETLTKVIDEVRDEREKEAILSVLDSADEIDFDDFWRKKHYDIVGERGLTCYSGYNSSPTQNNYKNGFRKFANYTVRNRLKSAMTKLEKSAKLRAISEFSA